MSDLLDLHAQKCSRTAMLGCPLCIAWLNQQVANLKHCPDCTPSVEFVRGDGPCDCYCHEPDGKRTA